MKAIVMNGTGGGEMLEYVERPDPVTGPRQALVEYEKKRLPMTAEIVRSNRRGGPEGVIDAVEQLAPDGFDNVENVLSYSQREAIVRGYATKAGFAAVPGLAAVRA